MLLSTLAAALTLSASNLPAQRAKRSIAKLAIGEGVIVVNARRDGRVEVGAASGNKVAALAFEARAVRDWADSVVKTLEQSGTRRLRKDIVYRTSVDEPEVHGGSMSFTRHVRGGKSTYRLFFADRNYTGFPVAVTRTEARALIRALRQAAVVAAKPRRTRTATAPLDRWTQSYGNRGW